MRIGVLTFFLIAQLFVILHGQSMSITSTSTNVGDSSVNYTFSITNASSVTSITFTFTSWSYLTQVPYSASTKCFLNSTSISIFQFPSNQIQCTMSSTGNQNFSITLTNMLNPSSMKPYQVNATISNSSTTVAISAKLTATTTKNFPLTFVSYSTLIGSTSNSIQLDSFMNNYIDPTTFLSLTYNSTLININFPNTTSYTVLQNINGTALFSSWNGLSSNTGKIILTNIGITNPLAAITYTITGLFYFK